MKKSFRIISDLHLEKNDLKNTLKTLDNFQNNKFVDNLIIGGDVTVYKKINLLNELFNELKYYKNIIYVLGNHEFMGTDFRRQSSSTTSTTIPVSISLKQISEKDKIINCYKNFCKKYKNVTILENSSVNISGINIYGSTFWTDHLKNETRYSNNMKQAHNHSKNSLENKINKKSDIIVTHYVPSHSLVYEKYGNYGISSNSDHLLKKSNYWIYGHIHKKQIKQINQTLTICNPLCIEDYVLELD